MTKLFLFLLALTPAWAMPLLAQSYVFSTPVGSAGQPAARDGTNNNARFSYPGGIAADNSGNLYVADSANHAIRKVTRVGGNWVVTTIAGLLGASGSKDGTNSIARFHYPYGIAFQAGFLYVADTYNHTIRVLSPMGTNWAVTTLAGSAGNPGTMDATGTNAQFNFPYGITADPAGNVYVADSYNHAIREISPEGSVVTIAGTAGVPGLVDGTNGSAGFNYPSGITVDHNGNLFVADTFNDTIREITPIGTDWVVTRIAGLPRFPGSADGTNRFAQFDSPFGIAIGGSGALYVADTVNHTLRSLTPLGTNWVVTTLAGQAGSAGTADGIGTDARFYNPYALALDSAGNLFVADTDNHTIRLGQPGFALRAALISGQLVLSWPLGASNYVLETSSTPGSGGPWTPITSGIAISGNSFVKTNSISPGQAFFRLHLSGQPGFSLQAALISGQLVLSWPLGASNYVLETSSTPASGGPWSSITSGIAISGNSFVKTNSISPGQAFFRLHL